MIRDDPKHGLLTKVIDGKIIVDDVQKQRKRFHAPKDEYYTEASIEELLDRIAANLERQYPNHDFKLVELDFGRFNFIGTLRVNVAA